MRSISNYTTTTKTGFKQTITKYKARKCAGCPLKDQCYQDNGDRVIAVNHHLNNLKQKADKRLKTTKGIQKRKQRCFNVEPVLADIKHNHQFKHFMLRGIGKVNVEAGLLAIAHNLRKKTA